ncbi:flagellar motor protein MotB [Alkalilimnicola ehrlichii MLHE-1]|uniref:OmpA/MotB domain protein n=1 Tax=Alkalilimnicola ehrlichii (strain ATCC BAA-1101 / DSM 17681 / MLHE-1) TaxID=187272 RepID=Q0A8U0_ALKEH|nr:flagellar motor protein MotB [Alkalilimnicola ehrlichii]ABI56747.1 OmpA/MotB domain protein [Alkalilimnicola ehrlichii MLHE-1]
MAKRRPPPAWITTFADLMALLVVFFVMLFAFSSLDAEKYRLAAQSIRAAFGPQLTEGDPSPSPSPIDFDGGSPVDPSLLEDLLDAVPDPIDQITAELQEQLEGELGEGLLEVERLDENVLIRFPEKAAFPSGSADVNASFLPILHTVAGVLAGQGGTIRVSGHTDDVPIDTERFRSNWELSTARATEVVHLLLEAAPIEPGRFIAQGHADTRPLRPNTSPENRARNRRVDVLITGLDDWNRWGPPAEQPVLDVVPEAMQAPPPAPR